MRGRVIRSLHQNPAGQIAAGAGPIGVGQHPPKRVHPRPGRQHHPGATGERAQAIEPGLRRGDRLSFGTVGVGYLGRLHRALQLEQVHAELGVGEALDAFEHQFRPLARILDIVLGLRRVARQRIDQQFEHERYVVTPAGIADAGDEILLMATDGRVRVGPVPGEHLYGVAAGALDLGDTPMVDLRAEAAPRRFLEDRVLKGQDQALRRAHQLHGGRKGDMRVEQ